MPEIAVMATGELAATANWRVVGVAAGLGRTVML